MKKKNNAVVLLPTYNEIDNLERIVSAVLEVAAIDIKILDDNSPDGTGALADKLAEKHESVSVVHRPGKEGLGRAYIEGFQRALNEGYEYVVQMDADFSHPPSVIPRFLQLIETADVVVGSRWVPGGGVRRWPWYRQVISRGGSFYARTVLSVSVKDLTAGFKCFRADVLRQLQFDTIMASGYAFQIATTYRAIKLGFKVVETPIVFEEREQGTSKMSQRIVVEAMLRVPVMRWKGLK